MTRQIVVHGESMIYVKGPAGSAISSLTELGLTTANIPITITPKKKSINVNAWGDGDVDILRKLAMISTTFTLIHYDPDVLDECIRLAMGGNVFGRMTRAGSLLGNGFARFAAGNNLIGFNLAAPISGRPWRFLSAYFEAPLVHSHGTDEGTVNCTVIGIPYTADPWQGGAGALNYPLFDRTLDT